MIATYGQGHTCRGYSTPGAGCRYFTTEQYTGLGDGDRTLVSTVLLGNTYHLLKIADYIWPTNAVVANDTLRKGYEQSYLGKFQVRGTCIYTLRNQSNEYENITAYYCKVRANRQFERADDAVDQLNTVYDVLGMGFGQKGLNTLNSNANNVSMTEGTWSPFDSPAFVNMFQVVKKKQFKLNPGADKTFGLRMRSRMVQPAVHVALWNDSVTTAWSARKVQTNYLKGAQFILFKLTARIAGIEGQGAAVDPKKIGYTTPTIICETKFKYKAKMLTTPSGNSVLFDVNGIDTGTANIMRDADFAAGDEKEAAA